MQIHVSGTPGFLDLQSHNQTEGYDITGIREEIYTAVESSAVNAKESETL